MDSEFFASHQGLINQQQPPPAPQPPHATQPPPAPHPEPTAPEKRSFGVQFDGASPTTPPQLLDEQLKIEPAFTKDLLSTTITTSRSSAKNSVNARQQLAEQRIKNAKRQADWRARQRALGLPIKKKKTARKPKNKKTE